MPQKKTSTTAENTPLATADQSLDVEAVVARVDEAGRQALTAMELAHAFVLAEEEPRQGALALVRAAFDYGENVRQKSFFTPMMEVGDFSYPPRVDQLTDDQCTVFGEVADAVRSPVARARLNDLCVERRFGDVGSRSRAAVDAYLEMATADPYSLDGDRRLFLSVERVDWLGRALVLASRMRDAERVGQSVSAIVAATKDSLAQAESEPGVALGLIGVLVDADREEADDLLSAARAKYSRDFFNLDDVLVFQLRRLKGESADGSRRILQRERVVGFMEHAETREPLIRMVLLQDAIKLARDYGFGDLVQECTRRLESITEEDLDLKEMRVEVPIPPGAIDAGIEEIVDVDSWQDALRQLCAAPPSGRMETNRAAVDKQMHEYPLRSLFPEELIGGDGLPRLRIVSDEEKRSKRLVEHETLSIHLHALVIHPALHRIWEKWGPFPPEELASFLGERRHVTPELAGALARAFNRFWNGDAEGALFTATPRLEALVRALVLAGGLPAYRTQRESKPGQYPGLGAMLGMLLGAGFDESWARYLSTLLADPMGANQRNELLHGFIDEPGVAMAALVLVGALFLSVGVELTND